MDTPKKVTILYFTDILCVWAYLAQVRIDQLKIKFGSRIVLQNHFVSVFGAVESKMDKKWGSKGGISAYSKHVQEIASGRSISLQGVVHHKCLLFTLLLTSLIIFQCPGTPR